MSCQDCETFQNNGAVAYYRWKNTNIGISGCTKHVKEIMDVLNEVLK